MYPPDVLSLVGTTYIYITCTFVHTGNYIKRIYGSQMAKLAVSTSVEVVCGPLI